MGTAFCNIPREEFGLAYFPTVALSTGDKCFLNFGSLPLQYPIEEYSPLQGGADYQQKQIKYLCKCLKKLLSVHQNIKTQTKGEEEQQNQITQEEIIILFAIVFQYLIPLLKNTKTAHLEFVKLLNSKKLTENQINYIMQLLLENCKKEEKDKILSLLFWEIRYRMGVTSPLLENEKLNRFILLILKLIKIEKIAEFLHKNKGIFNLILDKCFDFHAPSNDELIEMFSDDNFYEIYIENKKDYTKHKNYQYYLKKINNYHDLMYIFLNYLLNIQKGEYLANFIDDWIHSHITKSFHLRGYTITHNSNKIQTKMIILNFFISLLEYLQNQFQINKSQFLYHNMILLLLSEKDNFFSGLKRVGGTLNYVKKTFLINERDLSSSKASNLLLHAQTEKLLFLFKTALIIGNSFDFISDFPLKKIAFLNKLKSKESKISFSNQGIKRVISCCIWDEIFLLSPRNIPLLWNFIGQTFWFINYLQENNSLAFHYIPEVFFEVSFDLFFVVHFFCKDSFRFSLLLPENIDNLNNLISLLIRNISKNAISTTGNKTTTKSQNQNCLFIFFFIFKNRY